MNPVIERLLRVQPKPIAAIPLMSQLARGGLPPNVDDMLALAPEIEAARDQASEIASRSERIVERCSELKPIPSPTVPTGF